MPIVEQFTIRNPIIISENGQILSNKNKNEFLLPYFGINNVQNNNISSDEFFKNDIILNEEEILKESHAFITSNKGIINDIVNFSFIKTELKFMDVRSKEIVVLFPAILKMCKSKYDWYFNYYW